MKTLNQTAFARELGVAKSYVTQLKQAGRLVMTKDGKKVKVTASLSRIKETADQNRDDVAARHAEARTPEVVLTSALNAGAVEPETSTKQTRPKKEKTPGEVSFSDGRAKEQHYKALSAELEYKKTIGELVAVADVKHALEDAFTMFRQEMENLPNRIAPDLVGKDSDVIRTTLKQEIHGALANLERGCNEKITAAEIV